MPGVFAETARERRQPAFIHRAQRQGQHKAGRRRALGGEVREIHPQRLARQRLRWIAGQEMHAFDHGVRRHDDVVTIRSENGGVVTQTERTGIGCDRLEIARDQRVLAGRGPLVSHD